MTKPSSSSSSSKVTFLFPEIKGDPRIHLLENWSTDHLARRRHDGDTVSRVKWKILRSPSYARGRRNGPGGIGLDRREGGRGLGRYRGQLISTWRDAHRRTRRGSLRAKRKRRGIILCNIYPLSSPSPLVRKVSIQLTCDPSYEKESLPLLARPHLFLYIRGGASCVVVVVVVYDLVSPSLTIRILLFTLR